jgi:hypothetical protein
LSKQILAKKTIFVQALFTPGRRNDPMIKKQIMNIWQRINIGRFILIFLMIISVRSNITANETTKTTIAEGVADIHGENIQGARSQAIENALRNAIEQGLGTLMDAKAVVKNDELLEQIFTHTRGYVSKYEVIREKKDQDGLYRVTISALVKYAKLRNKLEQLGIIKQMMDYPRILMVPHDSSSDPEATQTAGDAMAGFFTDKRFDVVTGDPVKISGQNIDTVANQTAIPGQTVQPEIVITYKLSSGSSRFDGIMETVPVSLSAQAVATAAGQVLSSEQTRAFGLGNSPHDALMDGSRKAANQLSTALSEDFLDWWIEYTANGLPYHIVLKTSPDNNRGVADFQQKLQSIPGVTTLTEYASVNGVFQMRLTYKGRALELKQHIRETEPGIDIVASKGRYMELSF